ncbi:MAG: hypothetical protein ACKVP1_02485 [Burkholderiaceae bacterium]|jgi:hypothetical protein
MRTRDQHKEAAKHLEASAHQPRASRTAHVAGELHKASRHAHVPHGQQLHALEHDAKPAQHLAQSHPTQHQE